MKAFTVTNYKIVTKTKLVRTIVGKANIIDGYNEFVVMADNRTQAIEIADNILNHTNYAIDWYPIRIWDKK